MADIAEIGFRVDTSGLERARRELDRLGQGSRRAETDTRGLARSSRDLGSAMSLLGPAISAVTAAFGAQRLVAIADSYTMLGNRLTALEGSAGAAGDRLQQLFELAQQNRQSFEATASVYSRFRVATQEAGLSTADLIDAISGLQKGLVQVGASGQEAESAMIQLSQGLASGRLQGEELRAVLESAPNVARAIAAAAGIAFGELRDAASDGRIGVDQVITALQNLNREIDITEQQITVGQAFTQLNNALGLIVASTNEATSATDVLANTISGAAETIAGFSDNTDIVQSAILGIATAITVGLIPAVGGLTAALAINPLGILAIGAGAAVGGITLLINRLNDVEGEATGFQGVALRLGEALGLVGDEANRAADAITGMGRAALETRLAEYRVQVGELREELRGLIGESDNYAAAISRAAEEQGIAADSAEILSRAAASYGQLLREGATEQEAVEATAAGMSEALRSAGVQVDAVTESLIQNIARQGALRGEMSGILQLQEVINQQLGQLPGPRVENVPPPPPVVPSGGRSEQISDLDRYLERLRDEVEELETVNRLYVIQGREMEEVQVARDILRASQELNLSLLELEEQGIVDLIERRSDLEEAIDGERDARQAAEDATRRHNEELSRGREEITQLERFSTQATDRIADGFFRMATDSSASFGDMINSMLKGLADLAFQMAVIDPLKKAGGGFLDSLLGGAGDFITGLFGSGPTIDGSPVPLPPIRPSFAMGGAFSDGHLQPFAAGGVFSRPTMFPFANGVGLMAESGDEAIMPLRRDNAGRLGVAAQGGGSNVEINIINQSGGEVQTQERSGPNGREIEILITRTVAQDIGRNGPVGQAIQSRYGVNTQVSPRR